MPVSTVTYTANGSTNQFSITFPYIDAAHVLVSVNGSSASFTFHNSTTAQLSSTPTSGQTVVVYRQTPSSALVDFTDGSTLFESDLDLANTQARYISEEARDRADSAETAVTANKANIDTVAGIAGNVTTVAGANANIAAVAGSVSNVNTVAGVVSNVNTVAGISSAVSTVAADGSDIGTVAGISGNVTTVAGVASNVSTVAGISSAVSTVAADVTDIGTVAGISSAVSTVSTNSANVSTVAGAVSNVNTVAGSVNNVNTVAGKATEIGLLGNSTTIGNMNLLGTSDAVSDMNTLGTSANVTNQNTLAGISSNITTVAGIASNVTAVAGDATDIGAVAGKATEIGLLGNSDTVADLALLGTSAVVEDLGLLANSTTIGNMAQLGTAAVVEDLGLLGTSANVTAMSNVSGSIGNVNTVATNLSGITAFSAVYSSGGTDPSSNLNEGDLFFNTSSDTLKVYDGSAWVVGVTAGSGFLPLAGGQLSGNLTMAGSQTVDGRDVSADGTKLDGIEAGANVTDTVNVVAALTAGSNITIASDGTIAGAAQYTHPTHSGDDAAIDTGALSGATVISDLDLNITTDTLGHVTDANATVATRNLTLANLGYTGETNATADQTPAQLLTAIKTVDGAGSGLDADTLDGLSEATFMRRQANSGLDMNNNNITDVEDIYLQDKIYHDGDTDTYIQFHASDQWRVVTGGAERLEVNNSRTQIDTLLVTGTATFQGTVVGADASTSLNAVGTYGFFRTASGGTDPGETRAGSGMYWSDSEDNYDSSPTPSGTWRCMGHQNRQAASTSFVRIS